MKRQKVELPFPHHPKTSGEISRYVVQRLKGKFITIWNLGEKKKKKRKTKVKINKASLKTSKYFIGFETKSCYITLKRLATQDLLILYYRTENP